MKNNRRFLVFVTTVFVSFFITASNANLITNGDFETGNLAGWNVFQTIGGTNGFGMPKVVQFDTCEAGVFTYAAEFSVGKIWGLAPGGGGIYQVVNLPEGDYELSVCTAVLDKKGCPGDWDGGLFEVLFDKQIVASYNYGFVATGITYRKELTANLEDVQAGDHEIKIRITRKYASMCGSPYQYLDCISLVPEPATMILLGLGTLLFRRNTKKN